MAKHDHNGHGHVTEVPDTSHIKNVDVTHETSDVNVPALLKFVLALTIMTAVGPRKAKTRWPAAHRSRRVDRLRRLRVR